MPSARTAGGRTDDQSKLTPTVRKVTNAVANPGFCRNDNPLLTSSQLRQCTASSSTEDNSHFESK